MDHQQLVENFYQAFQNRDYASMIACYHPDIHFSDEVFDLHGKKAAAMWHMLCERGKDLTLNYSAIKIDGDTGSAHWEPVYTFSKTGRKVHNIIDAHFQFADGKIIRHRDHFDLWRWMRMALGPTGVLLGWSGFLKSKVVATANQSLEEFIKTHPEYQ